jgi:tyrosine-specific transport protein
MTPFLKALAILATTIIGVGIFGLPFIASKAGFGLFSIYIIILTVVAIIAHLMYARVCVNTPGKNRFSGYVRMYIGEKTSKLAMASLCVGIYGALLAYLIVGGQFLTNLLSPYLGGNVLIYTSIYFLIGAFFIYTGIKGVSVVEFFIALMFAVILILFAIRFLPTVDLSNFSFANPKTIFLPYGIVLFSLWGSSIVPEMKEMIGIRKKKLLNKAIIIGIAWAALSYLLFSASIVGVCGTDTTSDAFFCLSNKFGAGMVQVGYLLGIFTCFSAFLVMGLTLKKSFHYDYHLPKNLSWAIASIIPFLLYFSGLKNYINIIGLTGAITIGIEEILAFILFKRVSEKISKPVRFWNYIPPIVLTIGVFLEISNFLFNK